MSPITSPSSLLVSGLGYAACLGSTLWPATSPFEVVLVEGASLTPSSPSTTDGGTGGGPQRHGDRAAASGLRGRRRGRQAAAAVEFTKENGGSKSVLIFLT